MKKELFYQAILKKRLNAKEQQSEQNLVIKLSGKR